MTDAERVEMLALMTRIEAKVDDVLEQLDGLLAVCERLEGQMTTVQRWAPGEATLH
jgi:hypothetical protein